MPICWTRARLAELGPKEDCSKNRAALRAAGVVAGRPSRMTTWADRPGFAAGITRRVTVLTAGITAGAVYSPDVVTLPVAAVPLVTPFTDQVTVVLVLPVTVATKARLDPSGRDSVVGVTEMVIGGGGGTRVTAACADLAGFTTEVARITTAVDAGMTVGPVYTPPDVILPVAAEPPFTPFTDQVTAVFVLPVTVAAKVRLAPRATVADTGATATTTGGGGAETVITAWANTVCRANEVARIVTIPPEGIPAGAV